MIGAMFAVNRKTSAFTRTLLCYSRNLFVGSSRPRVIHKKAYVYSEKKIIRFERGMFISPNITYLYNEIN